MRFSPAHPKLREEVTVNAFVRETTNPFVLYWMIAPAFFLLLHNLNVTPITAASADSVIYYLSFFWPVLESQYRQIIAVHSEGAASLYPLFCLAGIIFTASVIAFALRQYAATRTRIRISAEDFWILGVLLVGCAYGLLLDVVKNDPTPGWEFYVDPFGLFYFPTGMRTSSVLVCGANDADHGISSEEEVAQ